MQTPYLILASVGKWNRDYERLLNGAVRCLNVRTSQNANLADNK
jgi:hypothetical protein